MILTCQFIFYFILLCQHKVCKPEVRHECSCFLIAHLHTRPFNVFYEAFSWGYFSALYWFIVNPFNSVFRHPCNQHVRSRLFVLVRVYGSGFWHPGLQRLYIQTIRSKTLSNPPNCWCWFRNENQTLYKHNGTWRYVYRYFELCSNCISYSRKWCYFAIRYTY